MRRTRAAASRCIRCSADVRDLFAAQRLAIVPNVGPMMRPTSKDDYRNPSFPKPAKLFSHNDQQSTWQALAPEGAVTGWGGRMADLLVAGNGANAVFTGISASGNAVWLAGRQVVQYHVSTGGAIRIGGEATFAVRIDRGLREDAHHHAQRTQRPSAGARPCRL